MTASAALFIALCGTLFISTTAYPNDPYQQDFPGRTEYDTDAIFNQYNSDEGNGDSPYPTDSDDTAGNVIYQDFFKPEGLTRSQAAQSSQRGVWYVCNGSPGGCKRMNPAYYYVYCGGVGRGRRCFKYLTRPDTPNWTMPTN